MSLFPRTKQGQYFRSFQEGWYKEFKWLEYSIVADTVFCFPCRCFSGNEGNSSQLEYVFSKIGFKNWYRAIDRFKKHQQSKAHINSAKSLSEFLNSKSIDEIIDSNMKLVVQKREIEQSNNRKIMERLINITICLAKGGRPFRGHNEKNDGHQQGLFRELVNLLVKYDDVLKNHVNFGPKNAQYISNRIQNDIIFSIHKVLLKKIQSNLQNSYVSIIADETSDIGHEEQLSIVVRYFDSATYRPVESFITLKRMISVTANSIFQTVDDVLTIELGLQWTSVLSVCFDGASTMAGNIGGVQAKCKEKNSNILYVHCYAHCLNLSLIDSICASSNSKRDVKKDRTVFNFLGTVQFVYSFIEGSPMRHAVFEKISKENGGSVQTLKSCSTTRWACRAEAVSAIKNNYLVLLRTLKEIISNCSVPEMRAKGQGLLYQLKSFNFIFCLNMMHPILQIVLKVSSFLQTPNLELLTAIESIKSLKVSLNSLRNSPIDYQLIFENTEKMCKEINIEIPTVKKKTIPRKLDDNKNQHLFETKYDELRVLVFYYTLDTLCQGLDTRFKQDTLDLIHAVGMLTNLSTEIETTSYDLLSKYFGILTEELRAEVKILSAIKTKTPKGTNSVSVFNWLDWLSQYDRSSIFKQFFCCLKMFTIIPVTSCTCERTFSKLTIVKNKLRNTIGQERLNALLFLFVEQELTNSVDVNSVIDEFKHSFPIKRRLVL